jgi:hypothetical protein
MTVVPTTGVGPTPAPVPVATPVPTPIPVADTGTWTVTVKEGQVALKDGTQSGVLEVTVANSTGLIAFSGYLYAGLGNVASS